MGSSSVSPQDLLPPDASVCALLLSCDETDRHRYIESQDTRDCISLQAIMAATMNGSTQTLDAKADLHFKFLAHVQALPVVTDSLDQLYAFPLGRGAGETIKSVSATAFKFSGPINPLLKRADSLADSGLKNIESRFPLVKAPTSEIKEKTSGAAKTTVDTYVGAIHDKFGGLASKAKQDGQAVGEDAKAQTSKPSTITLHFSFVINMLRWCETQLPGLN